MAGVEQNSSIEEDDFLRTLQGKASKKC